MCPRSLSRESKADSQSDSQQATLQCHRPKQGSRQTTAFQRGSYNHTSHLVTQKFKVWSSWVPTVGLHGNVFCTVAEKSSVLRSHSLEHSSQHSTPSLQASYALRHVQRSLFLLRIVDTQRNLASHLQIMLTQNAQCQAPIQSDSPLSRGIQCTILHQLHFASPCCWVKRLQNQATSHYRRKQQAVGRRSCTLGCCLAPKMS